MIFDNLILKRFHCSTNALKNRTIIILVTPGGLFHIQKCDDLGQLFFFCFFFCKLSTISDAFIFNATKC